MFTVKYSASALKALEKIPRNWQIRIQKVISALKLNPYQGKKLQGKLMGDRAFRVWPYRIIYIIKEREVVIIILHIGHRQGIYG